MQGLNLRQLPEGQPDGYRCLVEVVFDHEVAPEDPLTDTLRQGAIGLAHTFWEYGGNPLQLAVAVDWEPNKGCVYHEIYRSLDEVITPITEIRFLRDLRPGEELPKDNPLLIKPE